MTYEEMNKQAVCQLLTLIKNNPDLPVVCQIVRSKEREANGETE